MFLIYVDESGDCGIDRSPTRYFVLSGLVVHELRWQQTLDRLVDFRRKMRDKFRFLMNYELRASALITRPGALVAIKKHDRLTIVRHFAELVAALPDINVINVVVDKQGKSSTYRVFDMAWTVLIQRFENTISNRNFAGPRNPDDRGMLFPDHTDDRKLTLLLRKMRRYNPIPSQAQYQLAGAPSYRNLALTRIIEDPNMRDSAHSLFIQAADLVAYLLYQYLEPNHYMQKKGGYRYFLRLDPVLCKTATKSDPHGVVRL